MKYPKLITMILVLNSFVFGSTLGTEAAAKEALNEYEHEETDAEVVTLEQPIQGEMKIDPLDFYMRIEECISGTELALDKMIEYLNQLTDQLKTAFNPLITKLVEKKQSIQRTKIVFYKIMSQYFSIRRFTKDMKDRFTSKRNLLSRMLSGIKPGLLSNPWDQYVDAMQNIKYDFEINAPKITISQSMKNNWNYFKSAIKYRSIRDISQGIKDVTINESDLITQADVVKQTNGFTGILVSVKHGKGLVENALKMYRNYQTSLNLNDTKWLRFKKDLELINKASSNLIQQLENHEQLLSLDINLANLYLEFCSIVQANNQSDLLRYQYTSTLPNVKIIQKVDAEFIVGSQLYFTWLVKHVLGGTLLAGSTVATVAFPPLFMTILASGVFYGLLCLSQIVAQVNKKEQAGNRIALIAASEMEQPGSEV